MCVVSAIYDGARQVPMDSWTPPTWAQFQDLLRRVEALDAALKQPDCHDPAKAAWMREVEARLAALEKPVVKKARKGRKVAP